MANITIHKRDIALTSMRFARAMDNPGVAQMLDIAPWTESPSDPSDGERRLQAPAYAAGAMAGVLGLTAHLTRVVAERRGRRVRRSVRLWP